VATRTAGFADRSMHISRADHGQTPFRNESQPSWKRSARAADHRGASGVSVGDSPPFALGHAIRLTS
jgi:hypothetical protein